MVSVNFNKIDRLAFFVTAPHNIPRFFVHRSESDGWISLELVLRELQVEPVRLPRGHHNLRDGDEDESTRGGGLRPNWCLYRLRNMLGTLFKNACRL